MRSSTSPVAPPLVPSSRHFVMISLSTASKECTSAAATRSSSLSAVAGGPSPAGSRAVWRQARWRACKQGALGGRWAEAACPVYLLA